MSGVGAGRDAGAVYRRLAPAVLGYLRGQAVTEPEDLLGEIFLQVARDLHRVKGDDLDVRRWVFGVARHRVIDQARRGGRRPAPSGEAVPDRAAPDSAEPFDSELLAGLAALTAEQREVVVLRFVADLPLEAVASITGRKVGAVKALQHRGLARLAEAVSPDARIACSEPPLSVSLPRLVPMRVCHGGCLPASSLPAAPGEAARSCAARSQR